MTKYLLTGQHFEGNISCYYDSKGLLVEMAINSWQLKADDHRFVLESMGYLLQESFVPQFAQLQSMTFHRAKIDLSFERFWLMYGNARNKMQAEALWNKLSENDKYLTLLNLKAYLRYCKRNGDWYVQMYPDTYLRGHHRDDWDKVISKPTKATTK